MEKRRKIMRLVDWIICVFTKTKLSPKIERRAAQNELRARERERDRVKGSEREIYLYGKCCLCYFYDRLINHGQVPCVTRVVSACCI